MSEPQVAITTVGLHEILITERPKLVRIASQILRDSHEAEDVVQATIAIMLSRADELSPRHVRAYVRRAVELNALKYRSRKRHDVSLNENDYASSPLPSQDGPDLTIDPVELEDAIRDLPVSQQVVLRLKFYTGMSFRQISERLEISQNTVASRCRYALTHLQRYFSKSH